jgi:transposase-like protein
MGSKKELYRYSLAFKQKIIGELENEHYTMSELQRVYGVSPKSVYRWMRQLGSTYEIKKVVRIVMKNEADKIKELEKEKQILESALAHAHLKILALESTIEAADELYQTDLKKNCGLKASSEVSRK